MITDSKVAAASLLELIGVHGTVLFCFDPSCTTVLGNLGVDLKDPGGLRVNVIEVAADSLLEPRDSLRWDLIGVLVTVLWERPHGAGLGRV